MLLLSLFISVNSSTATQDGTFHENTKKNGENFYIYLSTIGLYSVKIVTNACGRTKLNDGDFFISLDLFHTV